MRHTDCLWRRAPGWCVISRLVCHSLLVGVKLGGGLLLLYPFCCFCLLVPPPAKYEEGGEDADRDG
jgi:hypothetical protein